MKYSLLNSIGYSPISFKQLLSLICYLIMCHVPGLDNFLLKDLGKALALLYLAIGRLQGLKDKRRCCGCNILLAFRNGNATVTGGRSFARQGNDHFPEISKKLKKRTWLWIFTGTANGPIHPQNQPRKRKNPTGGPVGEKSKNGGAGGSRTHDLYDANVSL